MLHYVMCNNIIYMLYTCYTYDMHETTMFFNLEDQSEINQ